ncbi:linear amide C-N hydrolase [Neisseria sp. Ec49-e6-T10]|uniref:linear amide C-N hydrolase n=1 Tax=Neisseria sp. Ec49-e6-T10 TaxID=3140744 RepID=UPI003EBCEAB8
MLNSSLKKIALSLVLTGMLSNNIVQACTRVFWNQYPDHLISARNLDFFGPTDPALVVTPRGIKKTGSDAKNAATWQSRYGSVVIYASNLFPMDGMNEKGLVGHTLFFTDGSQIQSDHQKAPELQSKAWLSYILDNYSTVKEAIDGIEKVRLIAHEDPIDYATDTKHIAIEDASGDSAIIEISNGQVKTYHNRHYTVMTNPPSYDQMIEYVEKHKNDTAENIPGGWAAEDRLVRANFLLNHLPKPKNAQEAKGFIQTVTGSVAYPIGLPADEDPEVKMVTERYQKYSKYPENNRGIGTYWTSIADINNKQYHFKSVFASDGIYLDLNQLNFNKGQPVRRILHLDQYAQNGLSANVLKALK